VAAPAGNCEWHHHTVAPVKVRDTLSCFLNNSHELVTQDVALFHSGDEAVEEMQSDPQIAVRVILIMASCGFRIVGSSTL
jgi:hypothetical protein